MTQKELYAIKEKTTGKIGNTHATLTTVKKWIKDYERISKETGRYEPVKVTASS